MRKCNQSPLSTEPGRANVHWTRRESSECARSSMCWTVPSAAPCMDSSLQASRGKGKRGEMVWHEVPKKRVVRGIKTKTTLNLGVELKARENMQDVLKRQVLFCMEIWHLPPAWPHRAPEALPDFIFPGVPKRPRNRWHCFVKMGQASWGDTTELLPPCLVLIPPTPSCLEPAIP